jgi:beta-lactamase class A
VTQLTEKTQKRKLKTYRAAKLRQQNLQKNRQQAPKRTPPPAPEPAVPVQRSPLETVKATRFSLAGFLLSGLRLGILGVGLAAITGTTLTIVSAMNPGGLKALSKPNKPDVVLASAEVNALQGSLKPGKELTAVKQQIANLAAAQPELTPGLFFLNLDTGAYIDIAGSNSFSAASTIKVPVLVAFFQDVDAGKIKLDEKLVMRPDLVASESGVMQYQKPGTKFSALETADLMITISDNTATNMLIDRLGGIAALNQRFQSWGLNQTAIRTPLPDLKGTNTITPKELATLMLRISQGELVSARSRDRMMDIMRRTSTDTLLPQGLAPEATIAHKTGDIGSVVGDVGLIDMPNGQRYVAAMMVKRPHNDPRAQELIRQTSRLTYQAFDRPLSAPESAPPRPSASPTN